jgi:cob(I)alamin adenosyltransferase
MIHIYTGSGKGKTTSAFGLAMRASGQGFRVIIFQFFKPERLVCGEAVSAKKLKNIKIVRCEKCHPMFDRKGAAEAKKAIEKMVKEAEKAISGGKYKMVILDEIINVTDQGFLGKKKFFGLLKKTPRDTELILTGRGDVSDIEEFADYVTIMIDRKHPFRQRVSARRGIEY